MKRTLTFLALLLCTYKNVFAQNNSVRLFSGAVDMSTGFAGDGLIDSLARYNMITSIASDTAGNLIIFDERNFRIRKINATTHIVTTIAGDGTEGFSGDGGPAVLAKLGAAPAFNSMGGGRLTTDPAGNIYLYDFGNSRIRKIDHTTGFISTIAGGGTETGDSLDALSASVLAQSMEYHNGSIYFSDWHYINRLDLTTHIITRVFGPLPETAQLTFDKHGNMLFAANSCVRKMTPDGIVSIIAGQPGMYGVTGDCGPATMAKFDRFSGISVDTMDNIYLANSYVVRVIKAENGNVYTIVGDKKPGVDLLYLSSASVGSSNFTNYTIPVNGNAYNIYPFAIPYFVKAANKLVIFSSTRIMEYSSPLFYIKTLQIKDTIFGAPCTMPQEHRYKIYGTIYGTPTSDSVKIRFNYGTYTVDPITVPVHTYLDSAGTTAYAFGLPDTWIGAHTFTFPKLYPVITYVDAGNGFSGAEVTPDTVGNTCHYDNLDGLGYNFTNTIISPPCGPTSTVQLHVYGSAFSYWGGSGIVYPEDSVYVVLYYADGAQDIVVADLDDYGSFDVTVNHEFAMGMTGILNNVGVYLNSGIYGCDNCNWDMPAELNIPDCTAPGSATSSITTPGSSYTLCTTPETASLIINTALTGTELTRDTLSYYLNFGDGTDTTFTLSRISDGVGNYFMRDTIYHAYSLPGAYTIGVTPATGSGTDTSETIIVGTSCSHLSGTFYRDGNANCIADSGERRLSFWPMAVINNTLHDTAYAWCDTFGHYALNLINGHDYTIVPNYFNSFGLSTDSFTVSCPASGVFTITPSIGSTYVQDFGFTCPGAPTHVDMHVNGWSWGIIPGDTGIIGIWGSNDWGYMCDSLNATVTLTLDPLLTYAGMWNGPAPTSISGSLLTWNFHTVANLMDFTANVKVRCATTATMTDNVCNQLHVSAAAPIGDPDTTNNSYSWCAPVTTSWDPNEKLVTPVGFGPQGYIPNGTALTYVVHFQNTGTARARNITINDTISEHLNIATLQVVNSSFPVLVYQEPGTRIIRFRFNDIFLPDSTTNSEGSNGFVAFNIYPNDDLAPNTQIHNTGGIYFDYNPAVITNTTTNTIEDTLHPIAGGSVVCIGATLTLSNTLTGGIWSASNGHATVSGGVVTGVSAGIDTIYYAAYGGDQVVQKIITIAPSPDAGTISGLATVCPAADITLTASVTGGTWSSSSTAATVSAGTVHGVSSGTAIISYSVTNTCGTAVDTMMITVNALPDAGIITGATSVCAGSNVTLTNAATGGSWSSSSAEATVTAGMVHGITAGSTIISYTATNSCGTATDTLMMTVNPLPLAGTITGTPAVCVGSVTTLSNTTTGGSWTSSSAIATVTSGVVNGVAAGSAIISYSVSNMCGTAVDTMMVTVNPLPDAGTITGATSVCQGSNITLHNTATGGTWSSSTPAVASVTGGIVTGSSVGTTIISYTAANSCGTDVDTMLFSVISLPDAGTITGTPSVCVGGVSTLTNTATGGEWLSSTSDADMVGGVVTGINAGTVTIFYSVTNMCGNASDTMMMTILPIPSLSAITGTTTLCAGSITTLANSTSGGAWSSSATGIATVDVAGVVSGNTAGAATISYIYSNSCGADTATASITVTTLPDAGSLTGSASVCPGAVINLTPSIAGGSWVSGNTALATVSSSGSVGGVTPGSVTIYYIIANTCGADSAAMNITVLPIIDCPDNVVAVTQPIGLTLYPNPNNGTFTISGYWAGVNGLVHAEIVNVLGQVIYTEQLTATNGSIQTLLQPHNLAAGSYLVRLNSDAGRIVLKFTVND